MFRDFQGKWAIRNYPKTASTAFTKNGLVQLTSGYLVPCTSASTVIKGIGQKDVTSADADYAKTTDYPVLVPVDGDATMKGTVTGTFTQAKVGTLIDLSTALVADADASTTDVLSVEEVISSTEGVFKIARPQELDL